MTDTLTDPALDSTESAIYGKIPLDRIKFRHNFRMTFLEAELAELTESVRRYGVLTPIRVEEVGDFFELIAGERRVRACERAGVTEVPAMIIRRLHDQLTSKFESLLENFQRENLSPVELANALAELKAESGWPAAQVAKHLGFSESKVSRHLAVLTYPQEIQERLQQGELSLKAAAVLAAQSAAEPDSIVIHAPDASPAVTSDAAGLGSATIRQPAMKLPRGTADLGGYRTVSVAAPILDLENYIGLLQELLDKARKARTKGLTLTTFLKMLRDTARAAT